MTETDYTYLKHNNVSILVDAAIRDGDGYKIATTYPKKVDIRCRPGNQKNLVIYHGLENAPSAVSLYVVKEENNEEVLEKIEADITVTDAEIRISFIELPQVAGELELLVRSLI